MSGSTNAARQRPELTIGVEEEFFVVDPVTGGFAEDGLPDLHRGGQQHTADFRSWSLEYEFQLAIVESRTQVCTDLAELRLALSEIRRRLVDMATDAKLCVASAGTLPLGDWRSARITPKRRYDHIAEHYREVAQRRATCGCHVHIGIADRDVAVRVLSRVLPWLPLLLALSASSPFYEGADTGYHSFRSLLWGAFPVAGMPARHESYEDYIRTIELLIETGSILDAGHVYWDARLNVKHDTLEFRIADACTTIDESILQAGLCRALVLTCMEEVMTGRPTPMLRGDLLRAATWRAARSGLDGSLIDVLAVRSVAAIEQLRRFLAYVRNALEELGDWDEVAGLVDLALSRGTSSNRQHRVLAAGGGLHDIVEMICTETAQQTA
jgi:carboxylate-amine ligase